MISITLLAAGFLFAVLSDTAITQIVSAIVALAGVLTAYISLKKQMIENAKLSLERSVEAEKTATARDVKLNEKVAKIEVHTNSITEKLGEAMKLAGEKEGMEKEKARNDAEKAATLQATLTERERIEALKQVPPTAPNLIEKEGKIVVDDGKDTPVVVDIKNRPPIIPDSELKSKQ